MPRYDPREIYCAYVITRCMRIEEWTSYPIRILASDSYKIILIMARIALERLMLQRIS